MNIQEALQIVESLSVAALRGGMIKDFNEAFLIKQAVEQVKAELNVKPEKSENPGD